MFLTVRHCGPVGWCVCTWAYACCSLLYCLSLSSSACCNRLLGCRLGGRAFCMLGLSDLLRCSLCSSASYDTAQKCMYHVGSLFSVRCFHFSCTHSILSSGDAAHSVSLMYLPCFKHVWFCYLNQPLVYVAHRFHAFSSCFCWTFSRTVVLSLARRSASPCLPSTQRHGILHGQVSWSDDSSVCAFYCLHSCPPPLSSSCLFPLSLYSVFIVFLEYRIECSTSAWSYSNVCIPQFRSLVLYATFHHHGVLPCFSCVIHLFWSHTFPFSMAPTIMSSPSVRFGCFSALSMEKW